jgi:glycosyltransferase involved in cell wall biosynthesis
MENYKLCILGACKNSEAYLPTTLSNIDTIASWFKESRLVIYENDSTDGTVTLLQNWASQKSNGITRHVIKENNLNNRFADRTVRLAYIRNTLLCHIPPDFDYFMMVDLDDVFNSAVQKESFDSCFEIQDRWDVVTANGKLGYYDIWPLRIPGIIEFDCWLKFYEFFRSRKYTKEEAEYEAVYKFTHIMNAITEPTYVNSAFNVGMISKVSIVKPCCRYSGILDGNSCVEHVPFQNCLRSHGARILYNPNFRL